MKKTWTCMVAVAGFALLVTAPMVAPPQAFSGHGPELLCGQLRGSSAWNNDRVAFCAVKATDRGL